MQLLKILYSFFNRSDKRLFVFISFMVIFSAFVELLGVGSLFPYIKLLSKPDYVHSNRFLEWGYQFFHFGSVMHYLFFIGSGIFVVILLKAALSIYNNYLQAKLVFLVNNRLSKECFDAYMNLSYEKAIEKNSSVLAKHLLLDVSGAASVLQALLLLVTDTVVALALVGLMIWVDPLLILGVASVLFLLFFILNKTVKNRTNTLSVENERCNRHAYQTVSEALSSHKDIRITNTQNYFIDRYLQWRRRLSSQLLSFSVLSNLPANVLNVSGFGILLVILLYLMATHGSLVSILPIMGVIAVSVQRLLPSTVRVTSSIANIRRYTPQVYVVRDALQTLTPTHDRVTEISVSAESAFNESLSLDHLTYAYPKSDELALNNVSLTIKKNSTFGIVGESGAGKSTLIDVLLGLLTIDSGDIVLDGQSVKETVFDSLSPMVGYVPQQVNLLDASVKENIAFGVPEGQMNQTLFDRAISVSQLERLLDDLPDGLNTLIGEKGARLSGGQRQRIGIARALYRDPKILILDEATNALDAATEGEFNTALRKLMGKMTLIVISHRLSSLRDCDQIVQLDKGRVVASGTYNELMSGSEDFRRIYNITPERV